MVRMRPRVQIPVPAHFESGILVGMRHVILGIVGGAIVVGLVMIGVLVVWERSQEDVDVPERLIPETEIEESDIPVLKKDVALLVIPDNRNVWEEVIMVEQGSIRSITVPDDVDHSEMPVTDGERVYVIVEREEREIVAISPDGGEEVVLSGTKLLHPRGLSMSPDGSVLAFFMDNTRRPRSEFWVYEIKERRSLVSLELLASDARGPFWDANNGFLVVSGKNVFRGTPVRTGGERVAVDRDTWTDLVRYDPLVPSPTGNQVIYAVRTRNGEHEVRVWDIREEAERIVAEFSDSPRLLGWNTANALVVHEGSKLWSVTQQGVVEIPVAAIWSILSGDGEIIAVLEEGDEQKYLTLIDSATGYNTGQIGPFKNGVRLLQLLRIPGERTDVFHGIATDTAVAQEQVLRYLMEHLREITNAPVAEDAAPERAWFADIPGLLYIDYRIGTTLWRRLVLFEGVGSSLTHRIIAVYAPVAGEWVVMRGEEPPGMSIQVMYEYVSEVGKWIIQP